MMTKKIVVQYYHLLLVDRKSLSIFTRTGGINLPRTLVKREKESLARTLAVRLLTGGTLEPVVGLKKAAEARHDP